MILEKTPAGRLALQNKDLDLTMQQRTALIMLDGKRSDREVLDATAGVGVTAQDVAHLLASGLVAISLAPQPDQAEMPASAAHTLSDDEAQARYARAYPIATALVAALGLRGFRLNLAVEAAGNLQDLQTLAPKIKGAVSADDYRKLHDALYS